LQTFRTNADWDDYQTDYTSKEQGKRSSTSGLSQSGRYWDKCRAEAYSNFNRRISFSPDEYVDELPKVKTELELEISAFSADGLAWNSVKSAFDSAVRDYDT